MSTLEHRDGCTGSVVVVRYAGAPSTERQRITECAGCHARHVEPVVDRRAPVIVEGEGCDK